MLSHGVVVSGTLVSETRHMCSTFEEPYLGGTCPIIMCLGGQETYILTTAQYSTSAQKQQREEVVCLPGDEDH